MTFSGKIGDLPTFDILQYLHAGKKSGTLRLTRKGEAVSVYLQEGKIIHAFSQGRTDLGELLSESKEIPVQTLQQARALQKGPHKDKPVEKILAEMGAVTPLHLKQAVFQQTEKTICDLVTWAEGEFAFDPDGIISVDDISLNPTALLPTSRLDTTRLLSQALRLLDRKRGHPKYSNPSTECRRDLPFPEGKEVSIEEAGGGPPNRPEKIVLVTDDGIFKNLLRSELIEKGLEVSTPATVAECLSKCEASFGDGSAAFALIEDRLPGASRRRGAAMRLLAERERSLSVFPVLVMLDEMNPEAILEMYKAGALAVLPKPIRDNLQGALYPEAVKSLGHGILRIVRQFERHQRSAGPVSIRTSTA